MWNRRNIYYHSIITSYISGFKFCFTLIHNIFVHLIYLDFYSFYYDSHNFGTKKYQFYICTKLSLFLLNILHLVILSTALSVTSERRFISFKREQEFFYQKNLLTDKFSRPNHVITSYLQLQIFPDKLLLQSEVVFFDFIHCID